LKSSGKKRGILRLKIGDLKGVKIGIYGKKLGSRGAKLGV
jgi:hypothetical protein